MPPSFGTSGLRGRVIDLTEPVVRRYIAAFSIACDLGEAVFVGHDLRSSSPQLAETVALALQNCGHNVFVCGPVSTPALALAAGKAGASAVMVTGSHIPADRNGLKFYTPTGEISKSHEAAIVAALNRDRPAMPKHPLCQRDDIMALYGARYMQAFPDALQGQRIGIFAHSAVGREHLFALCQDLGATTFALGRSDDFVPLDTEAVSPQMRDQFRDWASVHRLDAIVSTDADGDRPLLTDETGALVAGDILGQITARWLGATHVVTPVSSNSGVELSGHFDTVVRTKIGSPYVLEAMSQHIGRAVGYEANGGFILGFQAGSLAPLMTRDALLPLFAVLSLAGANGVAALVADEPKRVTASDRLQEIAPERAAAVLGMLASDPSGRADFLRGIDADARAVDETDGVRMSLADDVFLHLRQSGNAPELRIYTEADDKTKVDALLIAARQAMRRALD